MITDFHDRLRRSPYWRDILWQASGNTVAQALSIFATPILTRFYTPQDFATVNIFTQVVSFIAVLMTWRYEYFIQLPKANIDSKALLLLVLWLGCLGTLIATPITYVYKDTLARLLGETALANWLILAPITAMLASFSLAFQHRVQRYQDYRKSGLGEVFNKGGYIGSGLLGYWLLPGAGGLVIASAVGTLGKIAWLTEFWNYWNLLINLYNRSHSDDAKNKEIAKLEDFRRVAYAYMRISGSLVFSHVMLAITNSIPVIFIAKTYDSNTLGQFALVISTLYLPASLIGNAIGQVYYQRAAERWAQGESFSDLWSSTARRLILIGLPLYTGAAFISPWAYPLVFGSAWKDAGRYAVPMCVGAFLAFATSPLDRACLVVNAWRYVPLWHSARAVTTGFVAGLAWFYNWSFQVFLLILVFQMSVMYMIDYWTEWRFSSRRAIGA